MHFPTNPDYADMNDGFGDPMAPSFLKFAIHLKAFVDDAYSAQNFRGAKTREIDTRRVRIEHGSIRATQTALEDLQVAYGRRKDIKWPSIIPPQSRDPHITTAKEEIMGQWANGR